MSIVFTEGSGVTDSIYGKLQAPVQLFLEDHDEQLEKESMLPSLFKMGESENFGDILTSATAMEDWEPIGEAGAIPGNSFQEGYNKMIVYKTFSSSFNISREAVDDARLMNLNEKPLKFITAYHRTRENLGAAIFAAAMSGKSVMKFGTAGQQFDIASADKLCVFHKAHPSVLDPRDRAMQQCNCFADAFSLDTMDRMEEKMQLFTGDAGELIGVKPDTIIIPLDAELRRQVFAAIGSQDNPLDATHAFNYQYGRWNVICDPRLNHYLAKGAKPWIMMDSTLNQTIGGAVWNDRTKLEVQSSVPQINLNRWEGYARFMGTFNDWRPFACGGFEGGEQLVPAV